MINSIFDLTFNNLKTKTKNYLRYAMHYKKAFLTLVSMFKYEGLPDTLPQNFLEMYILRHGTCFVWKNGDDLICSRGSTASELDYYGIGKKAVVTTENGISKELTLDKDVVMIKNNDIFASDFPFINWYASIMSEVDKSIDLNVLYSRYLPAPLVRDDKTKKAFDEYIEKLKDGDLTAVLSDNLLNNEIGINEQILDFTAISKVEKIQHLSRLHDDIEKRFYNTYGQALQTTNKGAQTTSDEIHGMDSASFIIPLNMKKCREEALTKINEIFGTNITVDFSPSWMYELERYVNNEVQEQQEQESTPEENPPRTDQEPDENLAGTKQELDKKKEDKES